MFCMLQLAIILLWRRCRWWTAIASFNWREISKQIKKGAFSSPIALLCLVQLDRHSFFIQRSILMRMVLISLLQRFMALAHCFHTLDAAWFPQKDTALQSDIPKWLIKLPLCSFYLRKVQSIATMCKSDSYSDLVPLIIYRYIYTCSMEKCSYLGFKTIM